MSKYFQISVCVALQWGTKSHDLYIHKYMNMEKCDSMWPLFSHVQDLSHAICPFYSQKGVKMHSLSYKTAIKPSTENLQHCEFPP